MVYLIKEMGKKSLLGKELPGEGKKIKVKRTLLIKNTTKCRQFIIWNAYEIRILV
jgi:hypothetical protein